MSREAQFLWGDDRPRPDSLGFLARSTKWWSQYAGQLRLTTSGVAELQKASTQIVSLLPDPLNWQNAPRPFRGLVVGAVQSGKTSSMLGVTAIALDQGYRIVVILAGGKDDLRQQTARRANTQLMRQRDPIAAVPSAYTLPADCAVRPNGGFALPYSKDIHQWGPALIGSRHAIAKGEPCVFVIKKHSVSLAEMRLCLGQIYKEFGHDALPTLVIDDECDDASVDKAGVPIPEAIANLWRFPQRPLAAYVGYTATAAANLLQHPDNELYPEHFVCLLRYPDRDDSPLTYREREPQKWYSGSDCFYEAFGTSPSAEENFLVEASVTANDLSGRVQDNASLADAVRAFIVSGAYRLALQPGVAFDDPQNPPRPHSMLVQTSASMDEHERWLDGLVKAFDGSVVSRGRGVLGHDRFERELSQNEGVWEEWYTRFLRSRERLYLERTPIEPQRHATWAQVKALIPTVVRNIQVKTINSDPVAGQDLDFEPRLMSDGKKALPQDIYVIAIGGSRLSRGITVEGLCISYFTRWNPSPTEDSVLQISRWFGYRGDHLAFCRLFTTLDIYEGLQEIHENDHDLRIQLATLMQERNTPRQAGLILKCNPRSLPTAKIGVGKVYELRFSPYQIVFRDVEVGDLALANQEMAVDLVSRIRSLNCEDVLNDAGKKRGFMSRDWDPMVIAATLDGLRFARHNPPLQGNPAGEFHKYPDADRPRVVGFRTESDPYQVAAYLRQWRSHAEARGEAGPPLFDVGVTFGEEAIDCAPFDFPLLNREITSEAKLIGQWTGRGQNWRGDALFDGPDRRLLFAGSMLRGTGLKGLLLLHVIHKNAVGRAGRGKRRENHTVTLGISIPQGGPPFKRVTVVPSLGNQVRDGH
jgi:hypothetical protein